MRTGSTWRKKASALLSHAPRSTRGRRGGAEGGPASPRRLVRGSPEVRQLGGEVVVLDDHVSAVAQRARVEDEVRPIGASTFADVPHQGEIGLARFDEAAHGRGAHG